jgi:hypothetical protein
MVNQFATEEGSMRARTITATGFAAFILMAANPALAGYGAFAHDEATGKYGFSWNEANQKQAEDAAIKSCNTTGCKELAAIQNCQKRTKVQCQVKGAECNR